MKPTNWRQIGGSIARGNVLLPEGSVAEVVGERLLTSVLRRRGAGNGSLVDLDQENREEDERKREADAMSEAVPREADVVRKRRGDALENRRR